MRGSYRKSHGLNKDNYTMRRPRALPKAEVPSRDSVIPIVYGNDVADVRNEIRIVKQ